MRAVFSAGRPIFAFQREAVFSQTMESLGSLGRKVKFCTFRTRSRGPNSVPKVRQDHGGVRCGRCLRESEYPFEGAEIKLWQNQEDARSLRRQKGGRKFGGPKKFF